MEEPFKALVKRKKTNNNKKVTASLEVLQWYAGKNFEEKVKMLPIAPEISSVKKQGKQINLGEISSHRFLNQLFKSDHAKYIKNNNIKMA